MIAITYSILRAFFPPYHSPFTMESPVRFSMQARSGSLSALSHKRSASVRVLEISISGGTPVLHRLQSERDVFPAFISMKVVRRYQRERILDEAVIDL